MMPMDNGHGHCNVIDYAVQFQQRVQVVELFVQRQSLFVHNQHLGSCNDTHRYRSGQQEDGHGDYVGMNGIGDAQVESGPFN